MFSEDSSSPPGPLSHSGATRYGLRVAGMRLAFPAGELLEFLPDAPIHGLPLAPSRLVGLAQLRGHPVAVFDFGDTPAPHPGERRPVLVVGEPSRAAALLVDEAPRVLDVDESTVIGNDETTSPVPVVALERILGPALRDSDGAVWWAVEPARLFELLAGGPTEPATADGDFDTDANAAADAAPDADVSADGIIDR